MSNSVKTPYDASTKNTSCVFEIGSHDDMDKENTGKTINMHHDTSSKTKNFRNSFTTLFRVGGFLGLTRWRIQEEQSLTCFFGLSKLYSAVVAAIVICLTVISIITNLESLGFNVELLTEKVTSSWLPIHGLSTIFIRCYYLHVGSKLPTYIHIWEETILRRVSSPYIASRVRKYMIISFVCICPIGSYFTEPLMHLLSSFSPIPLVGPVQSGFSCVFYDIDTSFSVVFTAGYCALATATAEKVCDHMSSRFKPNYRLRYIKEDELFVRSMVPKEVQCIQTILSKLFGLVDEGNALLGFLWVVVCFHTTLSLCIVIYLLFFDPIMTNLSVFLPYTIRIIYDVVLVLQLTFLGQKLKNKKQEILENLRGIYNSLECQEQKMELLSTQSYVGSATLGMDASGFFTLDRSFFLSVIGTSLTFFVVLVQFKYGVD